MLFSFIEVIVLLFSLTAAITESIEAAAAAAAAAAIDFLFLVFLAELEAFSSVPEAGLDIDIRLSSEHVELLLLLLLPLAPFVLPVEFLLFDFSALGFLDFPGVPGPFAF